MRRLKGAVIAGLSLFAVTALVYSGDPTIRRIDVDWTSTPSITTTMSFNLNSFKMFDIPGMTDDRYSKNIGYMGLGFLRMHASEIMKSSNPADGAKFNVRGLIAFNATTNEYDWDSAKIKHALTEFRKKNPTTELLFTIPNFYNATNTGYPGWFKTYDVLDSAGKVVTTLLDPSEHERFASLCARLVRIVNVEGGFNVRYWEPTNERDDPYVVKLISKNMPDKIDELNALYVLAAKAMKAVDPSIKIGGLAFARADLYDVVLKFIRAAEREKVLDFLSLHGYASGNSADADAYIYDRAYDSNPEKKSIVRHAADVRKILDSEITGRRVPLFLNEFNISWVWTNDDPRMHDSRGAVFDALVNIYAHDMGVDACNAWNERDGVYGKMKDDYSLQPNAHVYQLLNSYFIGKRAATRTDDEKVVVPFAVIDKVGNRAVMLINRSGEAQYIKMKSIGAPLAGKEAKRHQISSAGYSVVRADFADLTVIGCVVPPHSVTVYTESGVMPSMIPEKLPVLVGKRVESGTGSDLTLSKEKTPTIVDLSKNSLDWFYFRSPADQERKAALASSTTNVRVSFTGNWESKAKDTAKYSWVDGTPMSSATDLVGGTGTIVLKDGEANKASVGEMFTISMPADDLPRALRLYVMLRGSNITFTTKLGDAVQTYEMKEEGTYTAQNIVTIKYQARRPGDVLIIEGKVTKKAWSSSFVTLSAATVSSVDVEPPSAPSELLLFGKRGNEVALRWKASSDNVEVASYVVYDGVGQVAQIPGNSNSCVLSGLSANSEYQFTVRARDAEGNESAASPVVRIADAPSLDAVVALIASFKESGVLPAIHADKLSKELDRIASLRTVNATLAGHALNTVIYDLRDGSAYYGTSPWVLPVLYDCVLQAP